MGRISTHTAALAAVLLCVVTAGPAFAQGRGHDDHGRSHQEQVRGHEQRGHDQGREQVRFGEHQRERAHRYYAEYGATHRGRCPPGLAKKHNGCMPPGHAKSWRIGHPLPRDVVFYSVPRQLAVELGAPPAGYRYARVSNDILLIALGTGLVVDALQDLGSR